MPSSSDGAAGATIHKKFTTRATTGVPFTLAGSPIVSIYKDASLTESVAGVTLTADFDSKTGLNHVAIDTSADGTFYANGSVFYLVITTGTVNSVSVVGEVVGVFALAAALGPSTGGVNVTQILSVASAGAAGYVGIDWAHINAPTTAVNLSSTTIGTVTTNSDKANYTLSGSGLDNIVVEAGCNARQALSVIGAACGGLSTGVDVGSPVYKGLGVSTTRITATASSGNRSAVTLNLP